MRPVLTEDQQTATDIRRGTTWLLRAFAVLTVLAVVQLLLLADVADKYWAWTIETELTAAFLGAAYGAGFVLAVASLREREWSRIRIPVMTVTVFAWLTAAATVIHLHKVHLVDGGPFARAVAWVWLAVYVVIPIAAVVVVAREELAHRDDVDPVLRPMPGWLRVVTAVQAAALLAAGAALFGGGTTVHHHEPRAAAAFWPWPLAPLGAQIIGAWLLALAFAAGMVIWQRDLGRLLVPAMTYTAFGVFEIVALVWYWPHVDRTDGWLWAYLALLAASVFTGGYGWRAARTEPAAP
jgi:hypothetical protein